jgi:hypothetical protein
VYPIPDGRGVNKSLIVYPIFLKSEGEYPDDLNVDLFGVSGVPVK